MFSHHKAVDSRMITCNRTPKHTNARQWVKINLPLNHISAGERVKCVGQVILHIKYARV